MSKTTTKKAKTARRTSAKIRYEATGRNLTSQAGLIPTIKFLDALGFNEVGGCRLQRQDRLRSSARHGKGLQPP